MNKDQFPPQDDKQLNPSGRPPLSEKNFIHNGWSFTSLPFWLWLFLLATLAALLWGTRGVYESYILKEKESNPFLEVTNRDFSVFLWQFPSFLRIHSSKKSGYLPGFLATSENLDPNAAEDYVSAPPELIFLYHTWHRLIGSDFIERPIDPSEFNDFLQQLPEWLPSYWKKAPNEYIDFIDSKSFLKVDNLQTLPLETLPLIVRQAFQGWKNYFLEGPLINEIKPTYEEIKNFLNQHPHYARNFWRNIQTVEGHEVAGSNYLLGMMNETFGGDAPFPKDQVPSFLKVALFNAEQAKKNQ